MANELPINAGGMKVDYDEPTTISTSFFGGPWDGESHWVPYPLRPTYLVPVRTEVGIFTAEYIRCSDESGHYYVYDNYGQ